MEKNTKQQGKKYKLKGHETFCVREGWLSKGLKAVSENQKVFTEMYGADALGVGSNMAKAIRYWLKSAGLTVEIPGKGVFLSELGEIIFKYDPYLEENFTLWCIHINLVLNSENATSWYLFFRKYQLEEFTKEELEFFLEEQLTKYTGTSEFSIRSLKDDCNVLMQMYGREKVLENDPEDKRICPLSRLGILRKNDETYKRTAPDYNTVSCEVLFYLMQKNKEEKAISMEEFYSGELGVQSVLGVGMNMYQEYLEQLVREGFIDLNRTAGLDMIYKIKFLTKEEIALYYYKKVRE